MKYTVLKQLLKLSILVNNYEKLSFLKDMKQVLDFAFKTFFELFFRKFDFEEKMSKVSTTF